VWMEAFIETTIPLRKPTTSVPDAVGEGSRTDAEAIERSGGWNTSCCGAPRERKPV
jgi:hypothetical protein